MVNDEKPAADAVGTETGMTRVVHPEPPARRAGIAAGIGIGALLMVGNVVVLLYFLAGRA